MRYEAPYQFKVNFDFFYFIIVHYVVGSRLYVDFIEWVRKVGSFNDLNIIKIYLIKFICPRTSLVTMR